MKKYGCIYKLTNEINGKVYIGQTTILDENDLPIERWRSYKKLNCKTQPKLYNALKKYHPDNFSFEVLEYCYSKRKIDYRECYWMVKFDSIAKGYNIKEGGSCGKHSQETRKKMSLSKRGKKMSQEAREKMSRAKKDNIYHKGYKHSQETKDKISLIKKGNTYRKGKKHSQETIEKMSLIKKGENNYWYGKKHSKETKDKMSLVKKGENNPMYGKKYSIPCLSIDIERK